MPDFYVAGYDHDHCWMRQRGWGSKALLHVPLAQLVVPDNARQDSIHPPLAAGQGGAVSVALSSASDLSPPPQRDPLPAPFPNYSNVISMAAYRRRKAC